MDASVLDALREVDKIIPNVNSVFFFDIRRTFLVEHDFRCTKIALLWNGNKVVGHIRISCSTGDAYDFKEQRDGCNIIYYNNLSFGRQEGNEFT